MQPTDGQQFRNVLVGMGRMYGQELDKLVLNAYWVALSDWSLEDFGAAARRLMQTAKFMPRPADFHDLRKAGRPTAGEVWAIVLTCARRGDEHPDVSPAAKRALAAIGGIRTVMMSDPQKTPFLARSFAEHFETMTDVDDIREALPQIAGPQSAGRISGPRRALPHITRQT
jgi:hypothetical protein